MPTLKLAILYCSVEHVCEASTFFSDLQLLCSNIHNWSIVVNQPQAYWFPLTDIELQVTVGAPYNEAPSVLCESSPRGVDGRFDKPFESYIRVWWNHLTNVKSNEIHDYSRHCLRTLNCWWLIFPPWEWNGWNWLPFILKHYEKWFPHFLPSQTKPQFAFATVFLFYCSFQMPQRTVCISAPHSVTFCLMSLKHPQREKCLPDAWKTLPCLLFLLIHRGVVFKPGLTAWNVYLVSNNSLLPRKEMKERCECTAERFVKMSIRFRHKQKELQSKKKMEKTTPGALFFIHQRTIRKFFFFCFFNASGVNPNVET